MRRTGSLIALLLGLLSQAGCVDRFLSINSDPPGAAAYLDGEKVGTTPCEVRYVWYGTRDLILELRGYTLIRQQVTLSPPWWQIIPLDLLTDVVLPFTLRDRMAVSYTMELAPVTREEVDTVLQRADELRKKSESDPPPKQ
ncbi:MAG TPA: PEGA domain-containing protein [Planctomycetota bacterium]|nr:PEGA domain-containing protein [Planctomycetota bacterium]